MWLLKEKRWEDGWEMKKMKSRGVHNPLNTTCHLFSITYLVSDCKYSLCRQWYHTNVCISGMKYSIFKIAEYASKHHKQNKPMLTWEGSMSKRVVFRSVMLEPMYWQSISWKLIIVPCYYSYFWSLCIALFKIILLKLITKSNFWMYTCIE